jgi:HSP20 family molecular chaperone IbpA
LEEMDLVKNIAKDFFKEIDDKSREFFEFVLPPIDLHEENDTLIVTVDIPGFDKNDINVTLNSNVLSIKAEKKNDVNGRIVMKQRPRIIEKKMRLPIIMKEGEEKVNSAKYVNGVLTIKIPITKKGKEISLD